MRTSFDSKKQHQKNISITESVAIDDTKTKESNTTSVPLPAHYKNNLDLKHHIETIQSNEAIIYVYHTLLTELLLKSAPIYTSHKRQETIKIEIEGLGTRKAFAFVTTRNVLNVSNMIVCRITMEIKNPETETNNTKLVLS